MTRIKIVPNKEPNADGEWIEIPLSLPERRRWTSIEHLVAPHVPEGFHVVSVERGA